MTKWRTKAAEWLPTRQSPRRRDSARSFGLAATATAPASCGDLGAAVEVQPDTVPTQLVGPRLREAKASAYAMPRGFDRILLAIDAERSADKAAEATIALATAAGSEVLVVFAVDVQKCCSEGDEDLDGAFGRLNEVMARLQAARVNCRGLVWRSVNRSVAIGILDAAAEFKPGLVVITDDSRSGLRRLAGGSVCEKVSRRAGCTMLVVR